MVRDTIVVIQDLVKFTLGLAVIGIRPLLRGGHELADTADDQDSPAVILHGRQRPQRNNVVDFVGRITLLDVGQIEALGLTVQTLHRAERRIGDHHVIGLRLATERLGSIVGAGEHPLIAQVLGPRRVDLVGVDLTRIGRDQERAIACGRLIDGGVLGDAGQLVRQIGQRHRTAWSC